MAALSNHEFRSHFYVAPEPEPEPEPEPDGVPLTRSFIRLAAFNGGSALDLEVDELNLDDVEKVPLPGSGSWTLAQYSGVVLWDAATMLARWMHRYGGMLFEGQRVLEIGAGSTGLPGLTAWALGARQVVLSDYIPEYLLSLEANIKRCQAQPAAAGRGEIQAAALDWSAVAAQGPAALRMQAAAGQFDIVIGSEVIYEEEHAVWVSQCLSSFVRPGGVVYMIASTRPERPGWTALKALLPSLASGSFQLEVVPVQGGMPALLHEGILDEDSEYLHEMLSLRRAPVCGPLDEFPTLLDTIRSLTPEAARERAPEPVPESEPASEPARADVSAFLDGLPPLI